MCNIKYFSNRTTSYIQGDVPFIQLDGFSKFPVTAVFSTRKGGISSGQFSSMNFCTPLGDSIDNVKKNFEIFGNAAKLTNFVLSKQTHTINVRKVTEKDIDKGLYKDMDYTDVDGLVTNVKNITLSTFYADCVPLYFYDPVNNAIGLSHAGWRGTVNNIAKETLYMMNQEYGTKEKDVVCAIGPSICVNCYEVSADVANEFIEKYDIQDVPIYDDNVKSQDMDMLIFKKNVDVSEEKYMLNLWACNYRNLTNLGVLEENIYIPDICTCENKDILFSHRGLNGKRGNLGAFMMLR